MVFRGSKFRQLDLGVFFDHGFAEGQGLLAAAFDDMFVEQGIVGDGIFAVVTGEAEGVALWPVAATMPSRVR